MDILILSSSTPDFQEADGSPSLLATLSDALRAGRPEAEWRCASEVLHVTSSMKDRARRTVERHKPDMVLLRPTGLSFLHDDVASSVRQRWPRFYSATLSLSRFFDRFSGGRRKQGSVRRRLLFDLPRGFAAFLLGEAPAVRGEDAARFACETIDALAAKEDFDLYCRISVGNVYSNVRPDELARRVEVFTREVQRRCSERRVPFADNRYLFRTAGVPYDYAQDRIHPGLQHRTLEGRAIVAEILARLDGVPEQAKSAAPSASAPAG